jgi:hypothetical protein
VALWVHPILALAVSCKQHLRGMFCAAVANDPIFVHPVDVDDTHHTLDKVTEYDAFHDGFLVLPTLQNMYILSFLFFSPAYKGILTLFFGFMGDNRLAMLSGEEEDLDDGLPQVPFLQILY